MVNFEKVRANITLNNYNGDLYNNLYDYIYSEFSYIIKYRTDVRRKIEDYYEKKFNENEYYPMKVQVMSRGIGRIFNFILEQEEFLTEENKKLFFENYCLFETKLSKYIYEKFVKDFVEEIELDYSEREDYWREEEWRKRGIE